MGKARGLHLTAAAKRGESFADSTQVGVQVAPGMHDLLSSMPAEPDPHAVVSAHGPTVGIDCRIRWPLGVGNMSQHPGYVWHSGDGPFLPAAPLRQVQVPTLT
ncbi:hypothetical protein GCM10027290_18290 [Micromonospora sonneratiae]